MADVFTILETLSLCLAACNPAIARNPGLRGRRRDGADSRLRQRAEQEHDAEVQIGLGVCGRPARRHHLSEDVSPLTLRSLAQPQIRRKGAR